MNKVSPPRKANEEMSLFFIWRKIRNFTIKIWTIWTYKKSGWIIKELIMQLSFA